MYLSKVYKGIEWHVILYLACRCEGSGRGCDWLCGAYADVMCYAGSTFQDTVYQGLGYIC